MILNIKLSRILALIAGLCSLSSAYAANSNHTCPNPSDIQSTNFTAPSIWVAPPVAHSLPNEVAVGFGGAEVKELLGIEEITDGGQPGWVCIYRSEGGLAANEYSRKIRGVFESNPYLRKYLKDVVKSIEEAQRFSTPYLDKYPADKPLGFVVYRQAYRD